MIDKIRDKKQLVMEETGCDAEQAALILESTGNNVGKAIKVINSLLQHIIVIKGKFRTESHSMYGLLVVIADIKVNQIVRVANIVTCNPGVYQTSLKLPWHEFERGLYALRLADGSLQEVTQKLQEQLKTVVFNDANSIFFTLLEQRNREALSKMFAREIKTITHNDGVLFQGEFEEINLLQLKELKGNTDGEEGFAQFPSELRAGDEDALLVLEVELMKEVGGVKKAPREVVPGELVWAKIVDQRDIAQYVARLLGGRVKKDNVEETIPLAVPIELIKEEKLQVRFGPGILGQVALSANEMLTVISDANRLGRFWQKVMKIFSLQKE